MPSEIVDFSGLVPGLIELIEFFILALLGSTLMKLIQWDYALRNNQAHWFAKIGAMTSKLRLLRRQLEKNGGELPNIPLPQSLRRKWRILRIIFKVFSASKWVHS